MNPRHNMILKLIRELDVTTQKNLVDALSKAGIDVTQATISRDLKELGIVKKRIPEEGFRYVYDPSTLISGVDMRLADICRTATLSVTTAGNQVVIKTLKGMGSAVESVVKTGNYRGVVGILSGDDTCLVIMETEEQARQFIVDANRLFV